MLLWDKEWRGSSLSAATNTTKSEICASRAKCWTDLSAVELVAVVGGRRQNSRRSKNHEGSGETSKKKKKKRGERHQGCSWMCSLEVFRVRGSPVAAWQGFPWRPCVTLWVVSGGESTCLRRRRRPGSEVWAGCSSAAAGASLAFCCKTDTTVRWTRFTGTNEMNQNRCSEVQVSRGNVDGWTQDGSKVEVTMWRFVTIF